MDLSNIEEKELNILKESDYTLVFYEAPHRIIRTLKAMLEIFGDRYISISREISKLHESIFVGKISEALNSSNMMKGEFVIVVSAKDKIEVYDDSLSIVDTVNMYIRSGLSSMDAIKRVAKERNIPKNTVYMEFHGGENK